MPELVIRELSRLSPDDADALAELLIAVVDDGASIGFLPPLSPVEATTYWQHSLDLVLQVTALPSAA